MTRGLDLGSEEKKCLLRFVGVVFPFEWAGQRAETDALWVLRFPGFCIPSQSKAQVPKLSMACIARQGRLCHSDLPQDLSRSLCFLSDIRKINHQ